MASVAPNSSVVALRPVRHDVLRDFLLRTRIKPSTGSAENRQFLAIQRIVAFEAGGGIRKRVSARQKHVDDGQNFAVQATAVGRGPSAESRQCRIGKASQSQIWHGWSVSKVTPVRCHGESWQRTNGMSTPTRGQQQFSFWLSGEGLAGRPLNDENTHILPPRALITREGRMERDGFQTDSALPSCQRCTAQRTSTPSRAKTRPRASLEGKTLRFDQRDICAASAPLAASMKTATRGAMNARL